VGDLQRGLGEWGDGAAFRFLFGRWAALALAAAGGAHSPFTRPPPEVGPRKGGGGRNECRLFTRACCAPQNHRSFELAAWAAGVPDE